MIIGGKHLPSALMHSMAVTVVRLTYAPLYALVSSRPTSTFTDPSMESMTPVSSMLYTFSAATVGFFGTFSMTANQCTIFPYMFLSWRFQSNAPTRFALSSRCRFSRALA
jgi:hypothetical protein